MSHGWWDRAACIGRDPGWWTGDRLMASVAVTICIGCPVRGPCLEEALAVGDCGVIRGGMLLVRTRNGGRQVVSLMCAHCRNAPVTMAAPSPYPRYCSLACRLGAAGTRSLVRGAHAEIAGDRQEPATDAVGVGDGVQTSSIGAS